MSLVLKDEWGVIRWERAEQGYFSQKIQRHNQKPGYSQKTANSLIWPEFKILLGKMQETMAELHMEARIYIVVC